MQNIGQDTVRRVVMPLPDLHQQRAFVLRCDGVSVRIERVIRKTEEQIARLLERRQALITAAVTGQLDVAEAL